MSNKRPLFVTLLIALVLLLSADVAVFTYLKMVKAREKSEEIQVTLPGKRESVVVTLTDKGFVPKVVSIPIGGTVIFKSKVARDYWPASNSHPSHGVYPEFDPKQPVAGNAEWKFRFDKPGVWGFHDHLMPEFLGKVVVTGGTDDAILKCVGETRPGDSVKSECWQFVIQEKVKKGGMDAAFDAVRGWYGSDPVFRVACHDVMHIVGEEAYRAYDADGTLVTRPETSFCGYGFYHGFIETMFAERGYGDLAPVKAYCDATRKYNDINLVHACYHGIGHASFDNIPGTYWGNASAMLNEGAKTCEKVFIDDVGRERCMSGVTNALANALSARAYKLEYKSDVLKICTQLPSHYYPVCYPELAVGYASTINASATATIALFGTAPSKDARAAAITGYINEVVRGKMSSALDNGQLLGLCDIMNNVDDKTSCVSGIVEGLVRFGDMSDPEANARAFCVYAKTRVKYRGECSRFDGNNSPAK